VRKKAYEMGSVSKNLSVAVIGAGAAGLCAARHLTQHPAISTTVFELSDSVGGTWVYSETVGDNIHSSMYKNLKTNLPKEVMCFPDFPFPPSLPSFLHHSSVLQYLKDYSKHHQLERVIRYENKVLSVRPTEDHGSRWEVTSKCLKTLETSKNVYDSVFVCSGHYSHPVMPSIPGMDLFKGKILHSHNYRHPEDFSGAVVLVLGAGASGTDISVELGASAKQILLSHNGPTLKARMPDNVSQVKGVSSFVGPNTVSLSDGSEVTADAVILATGYHYTFPFLHDDCKISVDQRRVSPLYKHMINMEHPTMCLIGIPFQICPFPQFDLQVRFFIKTLIGEIHLPCKEMMLEDTQNESDWRQESLGQPARYFHKMGPLQWEYNRSLASAGGLPGLDPRVEKLYDEVHCIRQRDLVGYKQMNHKLEN